ncbi:IMP 5'-nucleotidase [Mortierella sp. AM989]|nr:IMP 5'-nucleotidase [Mortierella sp. AM989]
MTSSYRKRDPLIEFIKGLLLTPFVLHAKPRKPVINSPVTTANSQLSETSLGGQNGDDDRNDYQEEEKPMVDANLQRYLEIMKSVEVMIEEHRRKALKGVPEHSRLHRIVPSVASFFTPLPLEAAFLVANAKHSIAARRFVPPSFNDIRRILNTAQVMAIAPTISLITFDGDMTLYDDGTSFTDTSPLIPLLITLMRAGLRVAIVTAAGYPGDAGKYEERLTGLLNCFQSQKLSEKLLERFFVLGGECNYLFRCGWKKSETTGESVVGLTYIQPEAYQPADMLAWKNEEIQELLDVAEENLRRSVTAMNLKAIVIRKMRAVGIVPVGVRIAREQLDECVLSTQQRLLEYQQFSGPSKVAIPFCVFNGGNDVFVDIGNKLIGVQVLQAYLGAAPDATVHVGDQFLSTGNDFATRSSCCTLWIISPEETEGVLNELTPLLTIPADSDMRHSQSLRVIVILGTLFISIAKAHLTSEERYAVFQVSPKNPDYCSACLRKAMTNHFPHACHHNMPDPIAFASTPGQVQPEIIRCICVAFINPGWMRSDCRVECEFARYDEAMAMIPKVNDFPGCERWIDMKTITELDLPKFPKRNPDYRPVVYDYEDDEEVESAHWSFRDDFVVEKLTEEEILEDEDDGDCDLDEDDEAVIANTSRFSGIKEEL